MQQRRNATLFDVAQRAGVSTATVSRCLNNPSSVREETRKRVQEAVDELGYMPHFGGQALASNRTNTIGAVIPTMENAIFARGLQAMEEELAESGATLLVASSGYDPAREEAQVRALMRRGVDGLLLIGESRPEATYDLIERVGLPLVTAWSLAGDASDACVGFNNRAAARQMAEHVIDQGHRDIAMIAGITAWNDRAADRLMGVKDAVSAHGLTLGDDYLTESAYLIDASQEAFHRIWEKVKPTAFICGNDVIAAGAISAAVKLGLNIPGDISVTGFDDIELAEVIAPGITTVHVPHRRMGRLAAELLINLRNGKEVARKHEIDVTIIERGSLGPPPSR